MGLGAASVKAQVRIGGNTPPNPAAALDLNADDTNSGAKGLALPRVSLTNVSTPLAGTPVVNGMLVYNTNASVTGGRGVGIYYWDGSKWLAIAGESGIGGTVVGTVATYRTWCFPSYSHLGCWMIDNSREGIPSATAYGPDGWALNGYYYTFAQASSACPTGYSIPTTAQWQNLVNYVNMPYGDLVETWHWYGNAASAGFYAIDRAEWRLGGVAGRWWSSDGRVIVNNTGTMAIGADESAIRWLSVRCVRNN